MPEAQHIALADDAVNAYRSGHITREQAIARVGECLLAPPGSAAGLVDHTDLPSKRYRDAYEKLRRLSRGA